MWKQKRKEKNSFMPKMEKNHDMEIFWLVLVFWPYIFTLNQIDLILLATKRWLEDLKLCSLPKFQNLLFSRPKPTCKLTYCWKTGINIFYFPFWGACVLGFWMLYILKGVQGQPRFLLLGNLIFHKFFIVFIFFESLRA